jgi:hypothetical protein
MGRRLQAPCRRQIRARPSLRDRGWRQATLDLRSPRWLALWERLSSRDWMGRGRRVSSAKAHSRAIDSIE